MTEQKSPPVRLYLKHGPEYRDGWINLDRCPKMPSDRREEPGLLWRCLPYEDETLGEVYAEDVLHQVPQGKALDTLKHWRGLLRRPDSTLTVEVFDLEWACKAFLGSQQAARWAEPDEDGNPRGIVHAMIGPQKCGHPCGEFRSLYDAQRLYALLLRAGFHNIRREPNIPQGDKRIRFVAERGDLE